MKSMPDQDRKLSAGIRFPLGMGLCASLFVLGALGACGSDDDGDPSPPAGDTGGTGGTATGGMGGTEEPDAQVGGSGGEELGGSGGGTADVLVSNTPDAELVATAENDAAALVLIGSNLLQHESGSEWYQEWLGEVTNHGTTPVCHVQAEISFESGSGAELASHYGFADAAAYDSSGLVVPCIAPGQSGVVYSNGFGPTEVDLSSIATLRVTLTGSAYPGVQPSAAAPNVSGTHVVEPYGAGNGYFALAGTVTATASISYIILNAYPVDGLGLRSARLSDSYSGTLSAGASWDFETLTTEQSFSEADVYLDFAAGSGGYLQAKGTTSSVWAAEQSRQLARQESGLRREQFRSRAGVQR